MPDRPPARLIPTTYDGGKGSDLVHFRAPREFAIAVSRIHARDPHSFQTESDVWRLAARIGLDALQDARTMPTALGVVTAAASVLEHRLIRERGTALLTALIEEVDLVRLRGTSGQQEGQRLITGAVEELQQIPAGFWRDEFLHQIDTRVRPLLTAPQQKRLHLIRDRVRDEEEKAQ